MSSELPRPGAGVVAVASFTQANRRKRDYSAVVTVEDPGTRSGSAMRFTRAPYRPQLVLRFEDVDDRSFGFAHADETQVAEALEWGRRHRDESVLVHCQHGVGRSAALGLAMMADRMSHGKEAEAVEMLFAQRPEACPNLVVMDLADHLLGRNGALMAALLAYEETHPHMATRRRNRREYAETNPEQYALQNWNGTRQMTLHC